MHTAKYDHLFVLKLTQTEKIWTGFQIFNVLLIESIMYAYKYAC